MSLLDSTIVLSFDRTGFARHQASFRPPSTRDLNGASILITGGTDGIGLAAARDLAACGAQPLLWGRSVEKGQRAEAAGAGTFQSVDLGDLVAVRDAAHALSKPLEAVVLNAGSMPLTRQVTPQGHELMWGSQLLGHLLLVQILRDRGLLAPDCRVVWVSSGGMYLAPLTLVEPRLYQRHSAYANVKRAQVELSAHLAARWPDLSMAAMHPGWVATAAVKKSMPWFHRFTRPLLRTPEQGADTITWLVCREEAVATGAFWFDRELAPTHKSPGTTTAPATAAALVETVFAAIGPFRTRPADVSHA